MYEAVAARGVMALNGPRYDMTSKMGMFRSTGPMSPTGGAGSGLRIGSNFERGDEIRAIATIKLQEAKLNNSAKNTSVYVIKIEARGDGIKSTVLVENDNSHLETKTLLRKNKTTI